MVVLIGAPLRAGWRGIIAQPADAFQRHRAGSLDGPLVILFEQKCAHEADDRLIVREDATKSVRSSKIAPYR